MQGPESTRVKDTAMWVFGYGSLLWNPGFTHFERVVARLDGWHRSFCMRSIHHRGTPEAPGLVLALDALEGGTCNGLALRVPDCHRAQTVRYLRARELVSSAYLERSLDVQLSDGRRVEALTYVIDPDHDQYCRLALDEQARIIAGAVGGRGHNADYLHNTAAHLAELGIEDRELTQLSIQVDALMTSTETS